MLKITGLFGGKLLAWIDEELELFAIVELNNPRIVTKFLSEIDFKSSAKKGDIIEIGIDIIQHGRTSITLTCEARNIMTKDVILTIEKITMVSLDENGLPTPHGKTAAR